MKKWETVKECCERTGLCRNSVMKYFDTPGVAVRIGRSIRFDADAVDKIMTKMSNKAQSEGNEK